MTTHQPPSPDHGDGFLADLITEIEFYETQKDFLSISERLFYAKPEELGWTLTEEDKATLAANIDEARTNLATSEIYQTHKRLVQNTHYQLN